MLEKARRGSKALAQIAPQKLRKGKRGKGRRFGAKNAPADGHRLESSRFRRLAFFHGETAFGTDRQQHRRWVEIFFAHLLERLHRLLLPKNYLQAFRPWLTNEFLKLPER